MNYYDLAKKYIKWIKSNPKCNFMYYSKISTEKFIDFANYMRRVFGVNWDFQSCKMLTNKFELYIVRKINEDR